MKFPLISLILLLFSSFNVYAQDVRVFAGHEQSIAWMESIGWWGKELRAEQLQVPRTLLIAISPAWGEEAAQMPVDVKKEFFYRCLLPLVSHANLLHLTCMDALMSRAQEAQERPSPGWSPWYPNQESI